MKTIYTNKVILTAMVAVLAGGLAAQENNPDLSREMTLEREYDPTVQDANKVNTLPTVQEPEVKRTSIEYASYSLPVEPNKEINVLPSGNVMTDILYNQRKGYFNFGIGTYTNVNGDIGYHILNTETDKLNVFFSHRSTNGKVKYLESDEKVKAKLNDNLGGLNYKHSFDNFALKVGAKYGYTAFNYYGLPDPAFSVTDDFDMDTYQGNQQIGIYAGIASHANSPVGYVLDLSYTNFSQRYSLSKDYDGLTENAIGIKGGLNAGFNDNQLVGVDARLDYFGYSAPAGLLDTYKNYAEVTLTPYYRISESNLDVKIGANVMFFTGNNKRFFVSPNISAQTEFVDKTLLFFHATGEIQSNSAYQLTQQNRYADLSLYALPSRTWLDATLGVKSGIVPGFWFTVFTGYKITADDMFFVQGFPDVVGFAEWGNVSKQTFINSKAFKGGVELKYAYQKFVDIYLKTVYYNWNMKDDLKPYGKPELEFNLGFDIRPVNNLTVSADYQLASGRYGWYFGEQVKMKNISELNLTGTYSINDMIGAYVKINNVLNQKYELLPGYPLQGISAMVGANFNF
ncbi:MAG: TonB-dependent receptor [Tannerellaceae bacterium]|nr:TonB-dependent receptor [Tannerellaceae bacterium]